MVQEMAIDLSYRTIILGICKVPLCSVRTCEDLLLILVRPQTKGAWHQIDEMRATDIAADRVCDEQSMHFNILEL